MSATYSAYATHGEVISFVQIRRGDGRGWLVSIRLEGPGVDEAWADLMRSVGDDEKPQ